MLTDFCIVPIILAGGRGSRLWPLSRAGNPKQFISGTSGCSLLEETVSRVGSINAERLIVIGAEEHEFQIAHNLGPMPPLTAILLEPVARDTALAVAIGTLHAVKTSSENTDLSSRDVIGGKPDPLVLVCPSDHHVRDQEAFVRAINSAVNVAADGNIVVFGVIPTEPSSLYGYLIPGEYIDGRGRKVVRFVEKPSMVEANRILSGEGALWNAGIILSRASTLLEAYASSAADILDDAENAVTHADVNSNGKGTTVRFDVKAFTQARSQSIDYAVMESFKKIAVFPLECGWSDLGSWKSFRQLNGDPDDSGNSVFGRGFPIDTSNTHIHARSRAVVSLGVRDLTIVETKDVVLVSTDEALENLKNVVSFLKTNNVGEAVSGGRVFRPWGWFDVILEAEKFKIKSFVIKPRSRLSLQSHEHRSEHWVVVRGEIEVTLGNDVKTLCENESVSIPKGAVHRAANVSDAEVEIIEIQFGEHISEDDILRMEDDYGRVG